MLEDITRPAGIPASTVDLLPVRICVPLPLKFSVSGFPRTEIWERLYMKPAMLSRKNVCAKSCMVEVGIEKN